MDTNRSFASAIMWITYLAMLWFSIEPLGVWTILLAFVLMMPLLAAMGILWNKENVSVKTSSRGFIIDTVTAEKRKAIPIDSVLNEFSHEDLKNLREQLIFGIMDAEIYYDYGANDAELLLEDHLSDTISKNGL